MSSSGSQNTEINASNNFTFTHTDTTKTAVDALPTATTRMNNDAEVAHASINKRVQIDNGLSSNAVNSSEQTIKSFLAKPFPVAQGLFQSSDNSSTFSLFDPMSSVLTNSIYKNKIDGHLGFRATTIVRLQVNAERFQQGRYMLCFLPLNTSQYNGGGAFQRMHTVNKTTVTQLPHVEIDLNCDTEVVLEIPYITPASHYSILDGLFSIGSVFIYPYIPLTTGSSGSTSCEYTLWVSFKDVELAGPTIHQSNFEFQMAVKRRGQGVSEKELDSVGAGPISNTLYSIASATDALSKIPIISNIASGVSWAADIFADAASAFGWSNPIDLSPVHRMVQTIFPYANNCDAVDESMPLSLFSKNLVEPYSGFAGTDVDEMSFDFVKQIPAYYSTFNFTLSSTQNSILYSSALNPNICYTTGNDGTKSYYVPTPVAFVSEFFNYYRGSLKFTFKCAKTEFHSGRLLVAYAPSNTNITTPPTIYDTTYLHRDIIDLRMGNEFSFVFPWASIVPYRDRASANAQYGTFWVYVLNELVAPATVSSTVTFVVEVSAPSDMEFAFPRTHSIVNYAPSIIQSNFQFQMDNSFSNSCAIVDANVGSSSIQDDGLSSSRLCIGEKVLSFLSLLKKADIYTLSSSITNNNVSLFPFSGTVAVPTDVTGIPDNLAILMSVYGFSRGGVRIRWPTPSAAQDNTTGVITSQLVSTSGTATAIAVGGFDYGNQHALTVKQDTSFRGGFEVTIPMYNQFPVRVNSAMLGYGSASINSSLIGGSQPTLYMYSDNNSSLFMYYFTRAVADDFQLGYFISTVPSLNST
jgi:hypothetical protein